MHICMWSAGMAQHEFTALPAMHILSSKLRYIQSDFSRGIFVPFTQGSLHQILFLGADVLSNLNVPRSNRPKIHSRFGKLGLATKVSFPKDVKLAEISGGSTSLWFYSIVGIVRASVEYVADPKQQLQIMEAVLPMWKSSCPTGPFPDSVMISEIELPDIVPLPDDLKIAPRWSSTKRVSESSSDCDIRYGNNVNISGHDSKIQNQVSAGCNVQHSALKRMYCAENAAVMKRLKSGCIRSLSNASSISSLEHSPKNSQEQVEAVTDNKVLKLKEFINGCPSGNSNSQTECKSKEPSAVDGCEDQELEKFCQNSFKNLMHALTTSTTRTKVKSKIYNSLSNLLSFVAPNIGLIGGEICEEKDADPFILLTCEWIGIKFHSLSSEVTLKVEQFKQRNFDRIADLPPAKELVSELFPQPMYALLSSWMDISTEERTKGTEADCPDETEGLPHDKFSLLLLILEFANQVLVSGVAHVLYPKLITGR